MCRRRHSCTALCHAKPHGCREINAAMTRRIGRSPSRGRELPRVRCREANRRASLGPGGCATSSRSLSAAPHRRHAHRSAVSAPLIRMRCNRNRAVVAAFLLPANMVKIASHGHHGRRWRDTCGQEKQGGAIGSVDRLVGAYALSVRRSSTIRGSFRGSRDCGRKSGHHNASRRIVAHATHGACQCLASDCEVGQVLWGRGCP